MGYVVGEKIDQSDEWGAVVPESETKIPEFGIEAPAEQTPEEIEAARLKAEQDAAGEQTPEQIEAARIEQERVAAEALANAGKTPEQIEQERIAAEELAKKTKTPEQIEAERVTAEMKEEIKKQLLAEMGIESVEDIKKLKAPAAAETPEEKVKRLEKQEAAFQQYAVENDIMTLPEINSFKQLSAIPANDLVYADFATEFKAEHKDRQEDGKPDPVTDEEIREAFDAVFHTKSDVTSAKKAGERAIEARAKAILAEPEKKYNEAKVQYDGLMDRKAKIPEFKTFVQATLKEAIPANYTFTVDGREFSVETDGTDFAEIEKKFKDDSIFARFYDTQDKQGFKASIESEAKRQLAEKYMQKVAEIANKAGYSTGLKDGKVGAKAPFVPENRPPVATPTNKLTPEEKENNRIGMGRF